MRDMVTKEKIDLDIKNLGNAIGRCEFFGTASAFSETLHVLREAYDEMVINIDEFTQYS